MHDALFVNVLYYGDNLAVLREHIPDKSIDLVYLDPPFNSKRDYNVIFAESDESESEAQIRAFEDCWHWDQTAERAYAELTDPGAEDQGVPPKLVAFMEMLRSFLGSNDMMAYLVMMAIRLVELRRVLKPTGSLYLHCDPTASHYLKVLMDAIFKPENFRNEIAWKRRVGMSSAVHKSNRFGICTDTLLFYARTDRTPFKPQYNKDSEEYQQYIKKRFTMVDESGRRFQATSLVNPAHRPNLIYEYKGFKPHSNGWMITKEKMELWDKDGRLYFPKNKNGRIRRKSYADELRGMPVQNLWTDISEINSQAQERLGYPTQKPEALLERIIKASSNEGDIVLDPFCGCGTTIHAAERLNREWIGIDITHLAITLIRNRLDTAFPSLKYEVKGEPVVLAGARELANEDPYQFQWWALAKIGAHPVSGGPKKGKKGRDQGIDGIIRFKDHPQAKITKRIIISVKAGRNLNPGMIRDLRGTIEREKTPIGVFLTMYPPTSNMRSEAAKAGVWNPEGWDRDYDKIQILTIEDVLKGKKVDYPGVKGEGGVDVTLKKAPKDAPPTLPGIDVASTTRRRK